MYRNFFVPFTTNYIHDIIKEFQFQFDTYLLFYLIYLLFNSKIFMQYEAYSNYIYSKILYKRVFQKTCCILIIVLSIFKR